VKLADFSWLMTGVVLNAVAQLALKSATGTTGAIDGTRLGLWTAAQQLTANASFWLALFAYAISVAVWIVGLSRLPVSQAYPVLSVGYVITALLAWMLLGEIISLERWAGIGLIIVGVFLVASTH